MRGGDYLTRERRDIPAATRRYTDYVPWLPSGPAASLGDATARLRIAAHKRRQAEAAKCSET